MVRGQSTNRLALLIGIIFVSLSAWSFWKAYAAVKTWTGASVSNPNPALRNNLWTNQLNWAGNTAPVPGDDLVFGGSAQINSQNSFPTGTSFESLTIGGGHIIIGNSLGLSSGVVATGGQISVASIKLENDQTFNAPLANVGASVTSAIDTNGENLFFRGPGTFVVGGIISGAGRVQKEHDGLTVLSGNNTYTGRTDVVGGTLIVNGSQPQSDIVLQLGATLGGGGTTGDLTVQSTTTVASKVSPGNPNNGTAILNIGNLNVINTARSTVFEFDLKGTTVGSGYDQLNVTGGVELGASPSTLQVNLSFVPPPGSSFVIINNDASDGVLHTFVDLPEGVGFTVSGTTFVISYRGGDGNDVVLRVPETKRWDGGSAVDNKWKTNENWEGDVAPVALDNLQFPPGAARLSTSNDFANGTTFNSIRFSGAGYSLSGNSISLNAGINETSTAPMENVVSLAVFLNASQSFRTSSSASRLLISGSVFLVDKTLTLDGGGCKITGNIFGSGSITNRGFVSRLSGTNSYTGSTSVESGSMFINGIQPSSAVTVTNGTLTGRGTTGPLVVTGGTIMPGDLLESLSPMLTVAGNVTLNLATTIELHRRTFDGVRSLTKLKVNGAVNLGGSTLNVRFGENPTNATSVVIDNDASEPINGTFAGLPEGAIITSGGDQFRLSYVGGDGNDVTLTLLDSSVPTLEFSNPISSTSEDVTQVSVFVVRTGKMSSQAFVDYRTVDTDNFTVGCADAVNNQGAAFGRCDFSTAVGTLHFAANETVKTINVSFINDVHVEGNETFQVVLENPSGATLGEHSTATVTINASDTPGLPNPIFQSPFFVRQHYLDFLSREPEPGGFNAWLGVLNGCPDVNNLDPNSPSAQCDRIIVSQSFFGSEEFRIKGFYVFRFYKLAFNRLPEYLEIVSDMSFVAGATPQEVFQRKADFAGRFTGRQEFQTTYGSLSNSAFVSALMSRYQLTQITTPDPQQPDGNQKVTLTATDLTSRLNALTLDRAQVLRAIADSDQVIAAEFNNAFVATQYYGYLRRKPEPAGFNAWLQVLQSGNIRTMINGFMNSQEYRLRFGPP